MQISGLPLADDLVVIGTSKNELHWLESVGTCVEENGLQINANKSRVFYIVTKK